MPDQSSCITGTGVGFRGPHLPWILENAPEIPWFEMLADNHLEPGGIMRRQLDLVAARYPVTFHCVGMSVGGVDPLDMDYLKALGRLIDAYDPAWVSDHLAFTRHGAHHYHDLLPLPCTDEALRHVAERVEQVQEQLGRTILLENPSTYISFSEESMSEAEFLNALCDLSGCGLLVDINNAYVNEFNHGRDAWRFLQQLAPHHVRQIHLGGYEERDGYLLDAHNHAVSEPVWTLFDSFAKRYPETPVLIEWDNDLPEFETLLEQKSRADTILKQAATSAQVMHA